MEARVGGNGGYRLVSGVCKDQILNMSIRMTVDVRMGEE